MLVSPDNLASKLHDGLKPLYLIHGEETLTKLEAADAIRAAARKAGYSEREHFVVEAHFDWSLVTQSSDNLSLFATQRIVEITINTAKPSVDAAEFLAGIAADPPPDTLFIVILQKLDRAATDSAWFAACDRTGVTIAAPLVERDALPRWVKARLTATGFDASREVIDLICERCEGNLLAAKQEIEKLSLLVKPGKLDVDDVLGAVADVARYDVGELSEAFLRGDLPRYGRVLSGLQAEGEQAPRLSWQLSEDVHALGSIFMARRAGVPMVQALRNARVWGKRQKAMEVATNQIDPRRIATLLKQCATLDAQSKGQAPGDAWLTLGGLAALAHGALAL
ncbi:DNA polymerase III subunit delta [Casimicrobium huifangae]|jgi:DNA polymerase-3 subunit delta|uniref:DNA polymerase III subunit delta n=1 Tax=Casimicrobium huifangae TaxID=2591109 RepID=UPI0012EB758E|nr:DNA polymerase III subunit delta [Casimicrobium huifangae]